MSILLIISLSVAGVIVAVGVSSGILAGARLFQSVMLEQPPQEPLQLPLATFGGLELLSFKILHNGRAVILVKDGRRTDEYISERYGWIRTKSGVHVPSQLNNKLNGLISVYNSRNKE